MTAHDRPADKRPRTDVNPRHLLTLKIDGCDVSAREDETILAVARQNGITIPTLCHLDGLSERGACRLCIVEIKGMTRLAAACVTLVRQDMEVLTAKFFAAAEEVRTMDFSVFRLMILKTTPISRR